MELNDLHSSPNIIQAMKSRRIRWAGHVARIGERKGSTGFWWETLRKRVHVEDPGVDGRIILKWIFNKWDEVRNGLIRLRIGTGSRLL
jgi:hypothetical protein